MTNAELIYSLRYCFEKRKTVVGVPWYVWCDRAADALEAADKRIAELSLGNKMLKNTIDADKGVMLDRIRFLEAQLPKEGEWIDLFGHDYKCSVCGEWYRMDGTPEQEDMNYCPNCGAKMMKGEQK